MTRRSLFGLVWCGMALAQLPPAQAPPPPEPRTARPRTRHSPIEQVKAPWHVDAVALGPDGHPVSGLTAADFEISADGKPQKVTGAEFQSPGPLRIAFIVDDLSLSPEHIAVVKSALAAFALQMRPGDEAALLRTSSGSGALERFTSDGAAFAAAAADLGSNQPADHSALAFATGSLGALRATLVGLQFTRGRKLAVFLSERLRDPGHAFAPAWSARLTNSANRSATVLYVVDVGSTANSSYLLEQGLAGVAPATGGAFFDAAKDPGAALARIGATEQGYYVLRFETEPLAHLTPLSVKALRPGVTIRARNGVPGLKDDPEDGGYLAPQDTMRAALQSTLAATSIRMELADEPGQNVDALIHVDARDVAFTLAPDGEYHASLQTAAAAYQESERPVGQWEREVSLHASAEQYKKMLESGLDFNLPLTSIRSKGPYELRAAVVDDKGGKAGAAARFIEWDPHAVVLLSPIQLETSAGPNFFAYAPGHPIQYSYELSNLRTNERNHAAIQVTSRIFSHGRTIYQSDPKLLDVALEGHETNARISGRVTLGASTAPGQFTLEITVVDTLATGKQRKSMTRTIDFTIEP